VFVGLDLGAKLSNGCHDISIGLDLAVSPGTCSAELNSRSAGASDVELLQIAEWRGAVGRDAAEFAEGVSKCTGCGWPGRNSLEKTVT